MKKTIIIFLSHLFVANTVQARIPPKGFIYTRGINSENAFGYVSRDSYLLVTQTLTFAPYQREISIPGSSCQLKKENYTDEYTYVQKNSELVVTDTDIGPSNVCLEEKKYIHEMGRRYGYDTWWVDDAQTNYRKCLAKAEANGTYRIHLITDKKTTLILSCPSYDKIKKMKDFANAIGPGFTFFELVTDPAQGSDL